MAIVLTDGNNVKDYVSRIEELGGNVTPEVKEAVTIKLSKESEEVQSM